MLSFQEIADEWKAETGREIATGNPHQLLWWLGTQIRAPGERLESAAKRAIHAAAVWYRTAPEWAYINARNPAILPRSSPTNRSVRGRTCGGSRTIRQRSA
jgi:hypothetical protein